MNDFVSAIHHRYSSSSAAGNTPTVNSQLNIDAKQIKVISKNLLIDGCSFDIDNESFYEKAEDPRVTFPDLVEPVKQLQGPGSLKNGGRGAQVCVLLFIKRIQQMFQLR